MDSRLLVSSSTSGRLSIMYLPNCRSGSPIVAPIDSRVHVALSMGSRLSKMNITNGRLNQ
jgi:hypothetical protein